MTRPPKNIIRVTACQDRHPHPVSILCKSCTHLHRVVLKYTLLVLTQVLFYAVQKTPPLDLDPFL